MKENFISLAKMHLLLVWCVCFWTSASPI